MDKAENEDLCNFPNHNLISREFVINFFRDSIRDSFGLFF